MELGIAMEYLRLGGSGLKVSRLCIGCMSFGGMQAGSFAWTLDYEEAHPIIDRAIDFGINFFDTADAYSAGRSEEILGRAIKGRREDLVIATKVFSQMGPGPNEGGLSRKHIRQEVSRSLERLSTDYIDLYQTHRWDYNSPIKETLTTLNDLVRGGAVNYLGASSMWAWQLAEALDISDRLELEKFVSMQNHYNLVYREEEREMLSLCESRGIGIIPWSPLARGFLSGKYRKNKKPTGKRYESDRFLKQAFFKPRDYKVLDAVLQVAKDRDITPAQVSLAWLLHKPGVTSPIVGVSRLEHLEELVGALEIKLSANEMKMLEEPYRPGVVQGHS